jgi:hypothetical protein
MAVVLGWLVVSVGGVTVVLLTVYCWPSRPDGPSVWDIQADLPHRVPTAPLTLSEARRAVQEHRECDAEDCARKRAALRAQIAAGKLTPTPQLHELLYVRFGDETA